MKKKDSFEKDGVIHYSSTEKAKPLLELLLQEAKQVDNVGGKESLTFKVMIEGYRYQQDCRKRALDAAQSEHTYWVRRNDGKTEPEGNAPDVVAIAEKYYQWLITIPDIK